MVAKFFALLLYVEMKMFFSVFPANPAGTLLLTGINIILLRN
jgi:hypothetical protein